ncbi:MAG: hypothetical protein EXR07_17505 [Acetobacteraceae bacterium]|nr:hypothetical protein [Acetobacteraceae bacterium]
MDDIVIRPTSKSSSAETERRRKFVRQADANNRIEGIYRDAASDAVFDAYVRGDIEATEVIPRLKARIDPR